jgi:hypothetical protein
MSAWVGLGGIEGFEPPMGRQAAALERKMDVSRALRNLDLFPWNIPVTSRRPR